MPLASLQRRILASIVDTILAAGCVVGLLILAMSLRNPSALVGAVVLAMVGIPMAMAGLEFWVGSSPGKALVRIRVTDDDAGRLRFGRALRRNLLKWVAPMGYFSALGLSMVAGFTGLDFVCSTLFFAAYGLASLDFLAIWLSTYRQAIHDVLSDTLVLNVRRRSPVPPCPVKGLEEELQTRDHQ